MIRRDPDYWQRLRGDRRSSVAVLFTALAVLIAAVSATMVAVPGGHYAARANPLYWLILVPVAWWVSSLAAYEPVAVRSWKPVLAFACLTSAVCFGLAIAAEENPTLNAIGLGVTIAASAGALAAHRGSLVALEGPAR